MLSRTADNLFWIGRYVERAENMARLIDMGRRMATIPAGEDGSASEWGSVIASAGCATGFYARHEQAEQRSVVDFLIADPDNPSSVRNCVMTARNNARAVRTALTIEMWQALNETWLELRGMLATPVAADGLADLVEWIKARCALFRGVTDSTALQNDGFEFLRLGAFVERGDNTARILDVKYFALLPSDQPVGGGLDQFQWNMILRAAGTARAYHWVYRGEVRPWLIADFLIKNPACPRSLVHCAEKVSEHLDRLGRLYARRGPCHMLCEQILSLLHRRAIDGIFQSGLHEFLTGYIVQNNMLCARIAEDFHFGPPPRTAVSPGPSQSQTITSAV